tara:strand:- start:174 stop:449 length:276 start_codon:yes stop_codon:yes gene_type:complete
MPNVETTLEITNTRGLHARAAAKLVKCAEQFDASITVSKDGTDVTGTSIMGLLMLGASKGTMVTISAEGQDAKEAVECIEDLINNKFEEDH